MKGKSCPGTCLGGTSVSILRCPGMVSGSRNPLDGQHLTSLFLSHAVRRPDKNKLVFLFLLMGSLVQRNEKILRSNPLKEAVNR